jgi:FtsH-binding integral membrane protein
MGPALDDRRTRKLKIILIGLVVLMVAGCGLPLTYLRYGWTAYDTHQIINDDATTVDAALSMTMDMDCQVVRAFDDREVCASKAEKK